jgi:hypothetical protein
MTGDRVERRFLAVHFDAGVAAARAGDDFRDCRGVRVVQILRSLHDETLRSPIGDATQIGKGNAGVFLQYAFGCDAELRRALGDARNILRPVRRHCDLPRLGVAALGRHGPASGKATCH